MFALLANRFGYSVTSPRNPTQKTQSNKFSSIDVCTVSKSRFDYEKLLESVRSILQGEVAMTGGIYFCDCIPFRLIAKTDWTLMRY